MTTAAMAWHVCADKGLRALQHDNRGSILCSRQAVGKWSYSPSSYADNLQRPAASNLVHLRAHRIVLVACLPTLPSRHGHDNLFLRWLFVVSL